MDTDEQQPIIVIKKKGGHGGHHGGAWKVAYADFVTAMMAFFLVMWLVSQDQVIKDNVAGYFNDPVNWGKEGSESILEGGASILDRMTPPGSPDKESLSALEKAGNSLAEALEEIPGFESIKDHIKIEMTSEGLRIQLIEATGFADDSSYFFDLGSAQLSEKGIEILRVIARQIGEIDNRIVVEGHTDSRTFVYNKRYSNWELSADRANSARKLMEETGLKKGQIYEVRGYAANSPMIKEDPTDARNRRIAIVVLSEDPSGYSNGTAEISSERSSTINLPVKPQEH